MNEITNNPLDGLLTREQLQAAMGWTWRTVIRHEHLGLPVIMVGRRRLYDAAQVRAWIMQHVRDRRARPAPRPAGRPRKTT